MIDMKCPICNSNLIITRLCDGIFPNPNKGKIDEIFCDKCKMHGTEELWQELIRTRKALDVAVDALKEYADRDNWGMGFAPWLEDGFNDALYTEDGYKTAEKALEQITALEQKDHFADTSKKVEQKDVK